VSASLVGRSSHVKPSVRSNARSILRCRNLTNQTTSVYNVRERRTFCKIKQIDVIFCLNNRQNNHRLTQLFNSYFLNIGYIASVFWDRQQVLYNTFYYKDKTLNTTIIFHVRFDNSISYITIFFNSYYYLHTNYKCKLKRFIY
jgi:hypothetical protein